MPGTSLNAGNRGAIAYFVIRDRIEACGTSGANPAARRAELAGEIDALASQVQEKMIALDHLDSTIKTVPPHHQTLPGEMRQGPI